MQRNAALCAVLAAAALAVDLGSARAADAEAGKAKAQACVACHTIGGPPAAPDIPSIAGQPALYTTIQLIAYRDKSRKNPIMEPLAATLNDDDIQKVAAWFEAQKPAPASAAAKTADPAKISAGQALAKQGHCGSCHVADYSGREQIPRLAGQQPAYLIRSMKDYREGIRPGLDGMMTQVMRGFSDADIENLAAFLAAQ